MHVFALSLAGLQSEFNFEASRYGKTSRGPPGCSIWGGIQRIGVHSERHHQGARAVSMCTPPECGFLSFNQNFKFTVGLCPNDQQCFSFLDSQLVLFPVFSPKFKVGFS
eukprot:EG_transcript_8720